MAQYVFIYGPPSVGDTLWATVVDDGTNTVITGPDPNFISGLVDGREGILGSNPVDRLQAMLTGLSLYKLDGPHYMKGSAGVVSDKLSQIKQDA